MVMPRRGLWWEQLIKRTRRKFFFEPASLLKKYGANPPAGVADLDREGLIDYHLTRLIRVSEENWSVVHLGETTCLGRRAVSSPIYGLTKRGVTEL